MEQASTIRVWRTMAERIEAGESEASVMCDYGLCWETERDAAVAAEREACAKVCEMIGAQDVQGCSSAYSEGRQMAAVVCANTIRAR